MIETYTLKAILLFVVIVLIACGRDSHNSLGGGYYFSGTSSFTGRIVKADLNTPVIIDAAIIEYVYDERYIVAVRVPAEYFKCRPSYDAPNNVVGEAMFFVDKIEFVVIEKSDVNVKTFKTIYTLREYLKNIRFTKTFKKNLTEEKSRLLDFSNMNDVDYSLCKKVDNSHPLGSEPEGSGTKKRPQPR